MKKSVTTFIIPLVFLTIPAFAAEEAPAPCNAQFQLISEEWAEKKKDLIETGEVSVSTDEGEAEVVAKDAKPTENWFGKPPNVETVDGYLDEAERAMQAGDTEACMAQLKDAQAAINPDGTTASGN
ncbi:hypothetical protein [Roseovarius aestuariivivens]|uniref:hypothetical protein n=1 Tax=Roseovarius aestuariivivens TaxID=1888910 RepID=UPI001080F686|nr:hypothetical protein [Roseovarius aestuariivivens]